MPSPRGAREGVQVVPARKSLICTRPMRPVRRRMFSYSRRSIQALFVSKQTVK